MSILSVGSYIIIIIIMIDYYYLPSGRGGNVLMLVTVSFRCLSICLSVCKGVAGMQYLVIIIIVCPMLCIDRI